MKLIKENYIFYILLFISFIDIYSLLFAIVNNLRAFSLIDIELIEEFVTKKNS